MPNDRLQARALDRVSRPAFAPVYARGAVGPVGFRPKACPCCGGRGALRRVDPGAPGMGGASLWCYECGWRDVGVSARVAPARAAAAPPADPNAPRPYAGTAPVGTVLGRGVARY